MKKFTKTKEEKIGEAGAYDVVRTTLKEDKDGKVKVRFMPPKVLKVGNK